MIKKLLQKDMNRAYLSKICNSKTFLCCFPQLVKFICVIWYPLWISIVSVHFWFNKTVCVKAKFTFGLKFISIFLQKKKKKHLYNYYNKYMLKKCPSSKRCRDSNPRPLERESLPITTRPGLPPSVWDLYQSISLSSARRSPIERMKGGW